MKYSKNLLFSLKNIIIIYMIQYIVVFVSSAIYLYLGYNNLTNFISKYTSIIMILLYIIIIMFLLKKYRYKTKKLPKRITYPLIYLGVSISCLLNMLIFLIFKPELKEITIPIYISIISTSIIGPILEEILFRYILLNDLKKFNKEKTAIIISTIIFALSHGSIIKILYALVLGLILNITYNKFNNIKAPILIHISANLIAIYLSTFNIYIFILSIIGLIISTKLIINNR